MGQHNSHEALALRWAALCNDPALRDLPYKIELNAFGTIEMSPASTRHARLHAAVAFQLALQLPQGVVLTECPVATDEGVRVPDVAWASAEFAARHGDATPLPQAPEICVEVRSPSNSDDEMAMKTRAYLGAGAVEVWELSETGELRIVNVHGLQATSSFGVEIVVPGAAQR